jgi:hypothetical protein
VRYSLSLACGGIPEVDVTNVLAVLKHYVNVSALYNCEVSYVAYYLLGIGLEILTLESYSYKDEILVYVVEVISVGRELTGGVGNLLRTVLLV